MSNTALQDETHHITVKCGGLEHKCEVTDTHTAGQLKSWFAEQRKIRVERLRLFFRGCELDDDLTMFQAYVEEGDAIYVKINPQTSADEKSTCSEDEAWPIRVRFLYREEVVQVYAATTVRDLKQHMAKHFPDMPAEEQHVLFRNVELDDALTMFNAFVQPNSALYIRLRRTKRDATPSVKSTGGARLVGDFSHDERVGVYFGRKLVAGTVRYFEKKKVGKNLFKGRYLVKFGAGRSDWVDEDRVVGLAQQQRAEPPVAKRTKLGKRTAERYVPTPLDGSVASLAQIMASECKVSRDADTQSVTSVKTDTGVQRLGQRERLPRVRLTNLPSWYEQEDVEPLFSGYRVHRTVVFKPNPRGQRRYDNDTCTALVTLRTKQEVAAAVRALNKKRLSGLIITAEVARENPTRKPRGKGRQGKAAGKARAWRK